MSDKQPLVFNIEIASYEFQKLWKMFLKLSNCCAILEMTSKLNREKFTQLDNASKQYRLLMREPGTVYLVVLK